MEETAGSSPDGREGHPVNCILTAALCYCYLERVKGQIRECRRERLGRRLTLRCFMACSATSSSFLFHSTDPIIHRHSWGREEERETVDNIQCTHYIPLCLLTLTKAHTPTLAHSLKHTLPHSHTHTLTKAHTPTLTHSHTHTSLKHTLTLTQSHSHTLTITVTSTSVIDVDVMCCWHRSTISSIEASCANNSSSSLRRSFLYAVFC